MTEEEKYRRKKELLRRAIRFADELDQAGAERGAALTPDEKPTTREAEAHR